MAKGKLHKWVGGDNARCQNCKLQRRWRERKAKPKSPVKGRIPVLEYRAKGGQWVESVAVPRCAAVLGQA